MLLFQNIFGPLPPSPPSSTEVELILLYIIKSSYFLFFFRLLFIQECDGFPPLPPSPQDELRDDVKILSNSLQKVSLTPRVDRGYRDTMPDDRPPAIPPHRGPSLNTLKTR